MSLKKNSHQLRSDICKFTKTMPVKSRGKKEAVQVFEAKMEQVEPEQVQSPEDFKLEEKKSSTKKAKPKPRAKSKK